jgi:hypothetical protein
MYNNKNKGHIKNIFVVPKHSYTINEKVNIILSPEFYWTKKVVLPVQNLNQSKKLIKSIFEEDLGDIKNYQFITIQLKNEEFLSIAYNQKEIKSKLAEANISLDVVNNIYFSTLELKSYEAFKYEEYIYGYQNDVLVRIPNSLISDSNNISTINFNQLVLTNDSFIFQEKDSYEKLNYLISCLLIILTCLYSFQAFNNFLNSNKLAGEISYIKTQYELPDTKIELRSIVDNNSNQNKYSLKDVNYIINSKAELDLVIKELKYIDHKFYVVCSGYKNISIVKDYFDEQFKTIKIHEENSILYLELYI